MGHRNTKQCKTIFKYNEKNKHIGLIYDTETSIFLTPCLYLTDEANNIFPELLSKYKIRSKKNEKIRFDIILKNRIFSGDYINGVGLDGRIYVYNYGLVICDYVKGNKEGDYFSW